MDDGVDDVDFSLPPTRLGCTRCELELTTVRHFLDGLSYENVNDVEVRATLRASRGFCPQHAWQFLDVTHDSLGAAIIYRDILGTVLAELRGLVRDDPLSRTLRRLALSSLAGEHAIRDTIQKLYPRARCPACRDLDVTIAERGHRTAYLCLPHLRTAAASGTLGGTRLSQTWALTMKRLGWLASDKALDSRHSRSGRFVQNTPGTLLDLGETAFGKPRIMRVPPKPPRPIAGSGRLASLPLDPLALTIPSEGCLVCTWANHDVIEIIPRSRASFPELLAALIEADDLCTVHAWHALDAWGGAAEARRYPLLRSHLDLLERPARRLESFGECRVCSFLAWRETDYCVGLGHLVDAGTSNQIWAGKGFICLPHLLRTIALIPGDKAVALVRRAIDFLQTLHADLGEYIRKEDYRFQAEPKGTEQSAPLRALATIAGPRWLGQGW